MLNIIFNRGAVDISEENYICSPDTYFNYNYEESWIENEVVKKMILDIDKSSVAAPHLIESPVLGPIAPEGLSGGVKALIIMYMEPEMIVNASACGDNCAKWILQIGKEKDITIRLGYLMEFEEPFEILIKNSGNIVKNYMEFLREWEEVEISEG